jgi:hypothetical protein
MGGKRTSQLFNNNHSSGQRRRYEDCERLLLAAENEHHQLVGDGINPDRPTSRRLLGF